MNTNRKIAIQIGVLYIIGTATGVMGLLTTNSILTAPDYLAKVASNSNSMILGTLLTLTMALALAMVPVVAFSLFKKFNVTLALGYVVFRGGLETIGYMGLVISRLMLIPLSRVYIGAAAPDVPGLQTLGALLLAAHEWVNILLIIVFALDALMLYAILYQSRLTPRWISIWGFIAILMHFITAFLVMFGLAGMLSPVVLAMNLPIFLQEMVMAVWLIVKGFNASAIASVSAKTATNEL
ncbi:MAG: DUF4386 domain-containing protein [Anaerolineaceae bacterium]